MIRAVVDTNVLISAVIGTGAPCDVVTAGRCGRFRIVTSPYIVEEFRRVMVGKLGLDREQVDRIAYTIARSAEVVPVFEAARVSCSDRADDAIIDTAIVGDASYIVTGDRRLRACSVAAVEFVGPAEFLALLEADTDGVSTL